MAIPLTGAGTFSIDSSGVDASLSLEVSAAKLLSIVVDVLCTVQNVRFLCLQIYSKSCYKFQICKDLPHLHACKLLVCTHGKLRGKCGNDRKVVRRKFVVNPLQTNYFATSLQTFASDLHIRKCVDYTNYTKPLVWHAN